MYNIKIIDDSDFYSLVELNKEMRASISESVHNFSCVSQLLRGLTLTDALAIGLYKNEVLVGFVTGYGQSNYVYFFSGVYIQEGHKLQLLSLLKKAEKFLPSKYITWESEASSLKGKNMLEKFGAVQTRLVYKKDL